MKEILQLASILNWRQLKGAAWLFFRHPLLFITAIPATARCIAICNRLFGSSHHRDNPANAFRHALWNMLLMTHASGAVKTTDEAGVWAATFTNWYEDFSPNSPLPRAMDLHNNKVGRDLFLRLFANHKPDNKQICQTLLPLLESAEKVSSTEELKGRQGVLTYITE